jgi:PAS domain S-box-containing protein
MRDLPAPSLFPPALRRLLPAALTGSCFFAGAMLGLAISRGTDGIAALWPANGILLSALLLAAPGTRRLHVLSCCAASLFVNWWAGSDLTMSAVFTFANLITVALAIRLIRRGHLGIDLFESVGGVCHFLVAALIAVSSGAIIAATAITMTGGAFGAAWLSWAASDLIGMVLIVSFTLTCARYRFARPYQSAPRSAAEIGFGLLVVLITAGAVFTQTSLPVLFLPLSVLVLATYRMGLLGAVAGTLGIALIGSVLTGLGMGPIALIRGTSATHILFFQAYLITLYATCLPLALLLTERRQLNERLSDSERRHRRILDRSREVIFETDLKGRWTYLNPAWDALTGYSVEESLGRSFLDTISASDREAALERLTPLYAREIEECHQELRYLTSSPDAGERWASVRSHLLTDQAGSVVGTYGTLHDVTARRAAEQARLKSEGLYQLLAENSNDMIVQFTLDGIRRYVSPASSVVLGYEPHELVGVAAAAELHPDDRSTVIATCKTLLVGAEDPICTYRQRHKAGHYVWLEASYRLLRDVDTGEPSGFIASVRDVGRRRQAELERSQSTSELQETNRLLTMAEVMGRVGHWRVDFASQSVFWSDVVCEIHGRPPGYAPALACAISVYHPDDRATVEHKVSEALTSGAPYEFQARLLRPDREVRHVIARGRAERGPDGTVLGLFGVIQDVTEARRAELALQETGDRLSQNNRMLTMAESVARLGHWRVNTLDGQHFWSDEVYRIHGLPRDWQPSFANTLETYHPDDRERVRAHVATAIAEAQGYAFRARVHRPDGTLVHVFIRGEIDRDADGKVAGLFGIIQDVTEQAETEALLRDREARFRLITEQAGDIISLHATNGVCRFISPAVRTVLGYDPDDILGTTLERYIADEDLPLLSPHRARLRTQEPGTVSTLRFRMRHAQGHYIWVEAAARLADYMGDTCIISVCRDISDQITTEAQLRDAREQAEAAALAKANFLANMSHEIRTPMNGVIGFTDLLLSGKLDADQRRQAELIADSGRAMMRLLNDILDLSKVEAGQMKVAEEPVDLPHALRACMKLIMPAAAQKSLALDCDFANDLPKMVMGDGLRLRQIVLNLLGNAVKFTESGTVTLRASTTPGTTPCLIIEVQDTGIGIAPERQAAVFEQFVQAETGTASKFGGTGLGLAISAQLARLMEGKLTVKSMPGQGTSFFLSLPLRPCDDAASHPSGAVDGPGEDTVTVKRGTRILVAEDHDVNQLLMRSMLERLECEVDIANNGLVAVERVHQARAEARPYALVLMDMQMPELDGIEATRRIRAAGITAAELPIVALTANAYADDIRACLEAGMQAHLAKPLHLDGLRAALARWTAIQPPPAVIDRKSRFSPKIEERYRQRKAEVIDMLTEMLRGGSFTDAEMTAAIYLHHKFTGTAAMFGDEALGQLAQRFDVEAPAWALTARRERLEHHLVQLRSASAGPVLPGAVSA